MASSRHVGLSTRVSTELHVSLSERARGEGVTLSTLVARLLEDKIAQVPGTELRPTPPSIPAEQLPAIQGRLEKVETWVSFLFSILVSGDLRWDFESVRCGGCGHEGGLEYFEVKEGDRTRNGVRCAECNWTFFF